MNNPNLPPFGFQNLYAQQFFERQMFQNSVFSNISALQQKNFELMSSINNQKIEIDNIRNDNKQLRKTFNKIQKKNNKYKKELFLLKNQNKAFIEDFNQVKSELEKTKEKVNELEEYLADKELFNEDYEDQETDDEQESEEEEIEEEVDEETSEEEEESEDEEQSEEDEESEEINSDSESEEEDNKNQTEEDKQISAIAESIVQSMFEGNMKGSGPIKGSIIIDAKTGRIVNSSFGPSKIPIKHIDCSDNSCNSCEEESKNDFGSMLGKLFGKKNKKETQNINNEESDALTQFDFSNFNKFNVELIENKLENINDVIDLSKKYPLTEKGESKLEKVDGLYEYNGKYYGINLETLNKLTKPLERLNKMIGLSKIKSQILEMILYYIQEFEKGNSNMLHTIIEGPPGVGKTEMGKILAEVYSSLGIIPSNKFKLVKRTDLIGEYVGHTAHKTQEAIDEAEGGVLFIDEAYSLGGGSEKSDTFSKECIDIINQNLSENKKKLIVIIAGYKDQLESSFFCYNPGLKRRFPFKYTIDGYSPTEVKDIYLKKLNDIGWKLTENIDNEYLVNFFTKNKDEFKNFGGDIENFILNSKFVHSKRVFNEHPKNRKVLNKKDFETAFERFKNNKKNKDEFIPIGLYI